jgi:Pyridoxamine 5'-phosphate oxidase
MSEALATLQDQSFARTTSWRAHSSRVISTPAFRGDRVPPPDGRPHAAMSVFVRRGTAFWLPTAEGTARERNVRREPWLTLTVTEGDRDAHIVVLIEGPADVVPVAEVPADVRAAITGDWVATWIRLRAERVLSYASEGALRQRARAAGHPGRRRSMLSATMARKRYTACTNLVLGEDREADDDGGEVGHQHQSVGRGGA